MTHRNKIFFHLTFLLVSLTSCAKKYLDIYTNNFNRGDYCYFLWTSDTTLSNPNSSAHLTFDTNNVVYVHRSLQVNKNRIRILNQQGKDISANVINIMGDIENNYLCFYIPTKDEIKEHPHYDQYYRNKFFLPNNGLHKWTRFDLERLGYIVANRK